MIEHRCLATDSDHAIWWGILDSQRGARTHSLLQYTPFFLLVQYWVPGAVCQMPCLRSSVAHTARLYITPLQSQMVASGLWHCRLQIAAQPLLISRSGRFAPAAQLCSGLTFTALKYHRLRFVCLNEQSALLSWLPLPNELRPTLPCVCVCVWWSSHSLVMQTTHQ